MKFLTSIFAILCTIVLGIAGFFTETRMAFFICLTVIVVVGFALIFVVLNILFGKNSAIIRFCKLKFYEEKINEIIKKGSEDPLIGTNPDCLLNEVDTVVKEDEKNKLITKTKNTKAELLRHLFAFISEI